MTPRNFLDRMQAIVDATKGEPTVRDKLTYDLMVEALLTNGFGGGVMLLERASPEKIAPAAAARAVGGTR